MQQLGDADHLKITLISTNNDNNDDDDDDGKTKKLHTEAHHSGPGKQFVSFVMGAALFLLIWDTTFRAPQDRWLTKDKSTQFLEYAQANPHSAIVAFLLIIAVCVVFMIPIGTPLTLGCGYIYKGVYGWAGGMGLATFVSMAGSALGAVLCFLLGRYMMRDRVRLWIRKYPLFDAIDAGMWVLLLLLLVLLLCTKNYEIKSFCYWGVKYSNPHPHSVYPTNYLQKPSCGRAWTSYHGHALSDTRASTRASILHGRDD